MFQRMRRWARAVRAEVYVLAIACRHPRTPWYARAVAACVVAYAFSPLDLIPDVIPVLGYLDDLILLPLGILLVRRLIPRTILDESREAAAALRAAGKPVSKAGAAIIIALWLVMVALVVRIATGWLR